MVKEQNVQQILLELSVRLEKSERDLLLLISSKRIKIKGKTTKAFLKNIFIDYAITVVPFPPLHSTPSCPPPPPHIPPL